MKIRRHDYTAEVFGDWAKAANDCYDTRPSTVWCFRPGGNHTMSREPVSILPFEGRRVRFESSRSFEDVRTSLRHIVPRSMPFQGYQEAMENDGGLNLATFEKVVRTQLGDSGFTLFFEIDHSQWLPLYGIKRKVLRWILGNPLIAVTMMRHDPEVGLFAPVELLLVDSEGGDGSTVIYDLPSALMAIGGNPPLLEAARVLDVKLRELVTRATGVS